MPELFPYSVVCACNLSLQFLGFNVVVNDALRKIFSHLRLESVRALRESFGYQSWSRYWQNANYNLFPPALSQSFYFFAGSLVGAAVRCLSLSRFCWRVFPAFPMLFKGFVGSVFSAVFSPPLLYIFGMPHWWNTGFPFSGNFGGGEYGVFRQSWEFPPPPLGRRLPLLIP